VIQMKDICYAYEDGTTALLHVNLSVEKGETLILRGANGCGKSTLLKIVNGLIFAGQGEYRFEGRVIDKKSMADTVFAKSFHQKIGYLFQNTDSQLFHNDVEDEIAFGPARMGFSEEEIKKRADDMIRILDIEKLRHRAPYHLSCGEKKKVALASILSVNPSVIVLDEPISGLDTASSAWIVDFLKSMKKAGKTIVIATHNERLADALADREFQM